MVSTDNPLKDCDFFLRLLGSPQDQNSRFNSDIEEHPSDLSSYLYSPENSFFTIKSNHNEVNLTTAAMLNVMNRAKGISLDASGK